MSVDEAMEPELRSASDLFATRKTGLTETNVAAHMQFQAWRRQLKVSTVRTLSSSAIPHCDGPSRLYRTSQRVGIYNADAHATIYCSTQGAFVVRFVMLGRLGISEARSKSYG